MAQEQELLQGMRERMEKSLAVLEDELRRIRTGRANPALIEDVRVNYYGASTPLKRLATITAPDPDQLIVRPYDPSQKEAIRRGLLEANLGLNPQVEEEIIRIKIPKLSLERREELVRLVREKGEETKVSLRNIRRDAKEEAERQKREGEISEDELYRLRGEMDKTIHEFSERVDQLIREKEEQIRTV
ncbi:TPA: ribosome recycling factor [Candidatus Bipolaricaulota bacterium]|nr:ribosome recycling factor [Candidatus Bipolaricaulota bacterium]